MANIEMNYYSGSEYIPLKPMADFSNMSGSLEADQIPQLDASKISSGVFDAERIPSSSDSVKKQILNYTGTGTRGAIQTLNYIRPYLIVSGKKYNSNSNNTSYSIFGFFDSSSQPIAYMMYFYYLKGGGGSGDYLRWGQYIAKVNNTQLTFSTDQYTYDYEVGITVRNDYVLGIWDRNAEIYLQYNQQGVNYTYLIIY